MGQDYRNELQFNCVDTPHSLMESRVDLFESFTQLLYCSHLNGMNNKNN